MVDPCALKYRNIDMDQALSAKPTGSSYAVETDDDGNVWARFSSDTQSKLQTAADSACGPSKDPQDCKNALAQALRDDTMALQPRFFVIDDLFELAILGGLVTLFLGSQVDAPELIKVDHAPFNEITSAASASPTAMVIVNHVESTTYTISGPLDVALSVATLTGGGGTNPTTSGCPTTPIVCQDAECLAAASTVKTCEVPSNKGCPCMYCPNPATFKIDD